MDYKFLFTVLVTIGGWGVSIGMYASKIKQHDKEIEDLKTRQNYNEQLLKSIDKQLSDLNTKFDLLIKGRLIVGDINGN